jgi:hypothetical protein
VIVLALFALFALFASPASAVSLTIHPVGPDFRDPTAGDQIFAEDVIDREGNRIFLAQLGEVVELDLSTGEMHTVLDFLPHNDNPFYTTWGFVHHPDLYEPGHPETTEEVIIALHDGVLQAFSPDGTLLKDDCMGGGFEEVWTMVEGSRGNGTFKMYVIGEVLGNSSGIYSATYIGGYTWSTAAGTLSPWADDVDAWTSVPGRRWTIAGYDDIYERILFVNTPSGTLYDSELDLTADGAPVATARFGDFDSDGTYYAVKNGDILRYDDQQTFLGALGLPRGTGYGEVADPLAVMAYDDGNGEALWVYDHNHRFTAFTPDGTYLRHLASAHTDPEALQAPIRPAHMAWDSVHEELYVLEDEPLSRILVYDADLQLQHSFAGIGDEPGQLGYGLRWGNEILAVAGGSLVYLLDTAGDRLLVYERDGTLRTDLSLDGTTIETARLVVASVDSEDVFVELGGVDWRTVVRVDPDGAVVGQWALPNEGTDVHRAVPGLDGSLWWYHEPNLLVQTDLDGGVLTTLPLEVGDGTGWPHDLAILGDQTPVSTWQNAELGMYLRHNPVLAGISAESLAYLYTRFYDDPDGVYLDRLDPYGAACVALVATGDDTLFVADSLGRLWPWRVGSAPIIEDVEVSFDPSTGTAEVDFTYIDVEGDPLTAILWPVQRLDPYEEEIVLYTFDDGWTASGDPEIETTVHFTHTFEDTRELSGGILVSDGYLLTPTEGFHLGEEADTKDEGCQCATGSTGGWLAVWPALWLLLCIPRR